MGKVKTRLAQSVGDEKALKIYQSLLAHTREIALAVQAERFLFYSNEIVHNDEWKLKDFRKLVQRGGGLGLRMEIAFEEALEAHDKVVIIGSDCASLTAEIVENALAQLDQHDFVIGPAMDGGYYLLGMKHPHSEVFKDIDWSTEKVLRQTIAKIEKLNKSHVLLPELSDIDYLEDWEKYGWEI